jgi:organic hydroperoxide reductase OsmC/OhrA
MKEALRASGVPPHVSGHQYTATVRWTRGADEAFSDRRYSRAHTWAFDGGVEVAASASPLIVRAPFSEAHAVDPEEAFVASVSSCHMLFFLDYAAQAKFVVDRYEDTATATMGKNEAGRDYVATIVLNPQIHFSGIQPTPEQINALHHRAHEECYIANSIRTEVTVIAVPRQARDDS